MSQDRSSLNLPEYSAVDEILYDFKNQKPLAYHSPLMELTLQGKLERNPQQNAQVLLDNNMSENNNNNNYIDNINTPQKPKAPLTSKIVNVTPLKLDELRNESPTNSEEYIRQEQLKVFARSTSERNFSPRKVSSPPFLIHSHNGTPEAKQKIKCMNQIKTLDFRLKSYTPKALDSLAEREFKEIANDPTVKSKQIYANPKSSKKNRYPDVLPNEETRVKLNKKMLMEVYASQSEDSSLEKKSSLSQGGEFQLSPLDDEPLLTSNDFNNNNNNNNFDFDEDDYFDEFTDSDSDSNDEEDYINANYIHANPSKPNNSQTYICCQAPLPNTFNDFWWMIWQEKVPVIVMLTKLKEKNRIKADMYWPSDQNRSHQYGSISVSWKKERVITAGIVLREMELNLVVKGVKQAPRYVSHLHYTEWPDFGVPESTTAMQVLIKELDIRKGDLNEPIVVHCSAGIGRTGTLLAIHIPLQQMHSFSSLKVDIKNTVISLRQQRRGMVQTKDQYKFIYRTLKDIMKHTMSSFKEKNPILKQNSVHESMLSRTLPPKGSKKHAEFLKEWKRAQTDQNNK